MNDKFVEILKSIATENNDTLPKIDALKTTLLEKGCTEEEIAEFLEQWNSKVDDKELENVNGGFGVYNKHDYYEKIGKCPRCHKKINAFKGLCVCPFCHYVK